MSDHRFTTASAVAAVVLAAPGVSLAGGTTPSSTELSTAWTAVSTCGSLSGLTLAWTSTANVVTQVRLAGIPAGCTGGSLKLALAGAAGASLATAGPTTVTGASQTLTPTLTATSTSVLSAHLVISGP